MTYRLASRLASLLALAAAAGIVGCKASPGAAAAPAVLLDPGRRSGTAAEDLPLLRQKAAMGLVDVVRAELVPRLQQAPESGPDPGRDALRALAIDLALRQDDQPAALRELQVLARDLDALGARASPSERARWLNLHAALLCAQQRFGDARGQSLEVLPLAGGDRVELDPVLLGDAHRDLARVQLALGQPDQALGSVRRALATHKDRLAVFEDHLLAVDILIAVGQPLEAVIAAGKLYDDAIEHVGPATLAHAEALAAAATATFVAGDRDASLSLFTDARKIWDDLQAARVDLALPLSARLQRRLLDLDAALSDAPS